MFRKPFFCLLYSLLASTYIDTDINHISTLQWHVWLLPYLFHWLLSGRTKYILLYSSNWFPWLFFILNTLYVARGTRRNSHLCRRFGNPGSLILSARNWDVAAASPRSSAAPADSSFWQIALISQHVSVSPPCAANLDMWTCADFPSLIIITVYMANFLD